MCHSGKRNPSLLCIGVRCWYYEDITRQSVGLCVILTNPANMNEHRQTGGFHHMVLVTVITQSIAAYWVVLYYYYHTPSSNTVIYSLKLISICYPEQFGNFCLMERLHYPDIL